METARRAVEKGQVDKAIREYQKVVQEDPKDVRVWLKIGDLYAKKGAKPEATETYTRVAKFYSDQGFYLKAVAVYKQILKLDPRLVEINLKLAELYRQLGLISDALQHFEMVAAYFHREGKNREALATVRQLVELDSENVATRIKLAELYSKEGMVEEAVAEFAHACDFLRAHNRIDDFIKVAERLLWHKSDNIELNKELATLYLRRGDPRRALQKLQICFKADGRDVDTLALLAQAFQALEQRGKTVSVLKELARILTETNQRTQAADVHRKILEFVPDDPDSRAFLGVGAPEPSEEVVVADEMIVEEPEVAVQQFTPRPGMGNPTGSFPLVRPNDAPGVNTNPGAGGYGEPEFGEAEFAEPESFSTDSGLDFQLVEDASSSYQSSVRGEANSEAINKILTETDVYVKYGLQQKAIEHLQRIFELDPDNVEGRERMKDILLSQGHAHEAVSQLIHLATLIAPHDPERAESYLREAQGLDPGNPEINNVAGRFRLDLAGEPEMEIVDDNVLDFDSRDPLPGEPRYDNQPSDAVGYAAGSPPGGDYYPDQHPDYNVDLGGPTEYAPAPNYDLDYPSYTGNAPAAPETLNGEPLQPYGGTGDYRLEGSPPPSAFPQQRAPSVPGPFGTEGEPAYDFELDLGDEDSGAFAEPGTTAEQPITSENTGSDIYTLSDDDIILEDEGEPVDGVTMEVSLDQVEAQIALEDEGSQNLDFEQMPITNAQPRALEEIDSTDLRSAEMARAAMFGDEIESPRALLDANDQQPPLARPDEVTLDAPLEPVSEAPTTPPAEGASLEDDLDEVDFFVAQALYPEARDILENLLLRYPNHPLVSSKLEEVLALETSQQDRPMTADPIMPHPEPTIQAKPSVMLEKPVDDEDADTHFDLGLAYKEMGLYDEAIKAFNKVISVAGRAVQCHLMLGLCHREQQNLSEAISQFKAGLYVDSISTAEKYGLYYEIGTCYEQLDDPQEALYYYEMIVKKQPEYRDVAERVERLRAQRSGAAPGRA